MVNTLSGSVCAYRKETVKPRFIRIDEVMALLDVTQDEAMDIALAAGARYQLAKIILVHKERLMKFMKHSARVPSSNKIVEKKFVRIGEGSMTYSIGHHRFIEMARAAGAVYKIGEATKTDSETKEALEGAVFGLFAKEDIVNKDGKVIVKADTQIERTVTGKDGNAAFTSDLPLGQYYVKELEAPKGYVKSDKTFDVDASYQGDKVKVIEFEAAFENAPIKVEISKTDITGKKELPGAKLSVIDADGKLVESWTSEAGKTHMIERLPVGKYTLREESAPYGYKVASDVTFEVKETAEIQKVSMKDEQAVGKIVIEKTDKVTGKPIEGVVFEVRDKDGKVLDTLTTDKNGHAESKELPICTYNEDGSFKEDIHYTVVETKAADGYILDETAHDVTLRYDDNAPDVVVATLKLANVPTEPKLPQTGDNANPLLYLGIGALALITGVGVGLRGRKKKNKQ